MATSTKTEPETTRRCDASKVKIGSVFSRHSFGAVTGIRGSMLTLRNSNGFEWQIDNNILEQEFSFADQYDTEEKVSRTRIIEVLTENSHTAMSLNFNKAPDPKVVAEALAAGQVDASDRAWQDKVKTLIAGEERTMTGHHTNSFDEFRRLKFIESGVGPRLVDPRTLTWLVVGRTRYEVK